MRSRKKEADIQRRWDRAKKWLDQANWITDAAQLDVPFPHPEVGREANQIAAEGMRAYCIDQAKKELER